MIKRILALMMIISLLTLGLPFDIIAQETSLPANATQESTTAVNPTSVPSSLLDRQEEIAIRYPLDDPRNKISLSLRNIDIIEALKFFSMKSGINIVPTQRVAGRVTLSVENARTKDVFDIMLRANNLAYETKGDIYKVMTEEEYKQLYGRNFVDIRVVKVFHLKYAIPEQAFTLLEAIKSEIGRLIVDPESGSVLLIDTPDRIIEAEKTLSSLEQKSVIKVFNLQYAKAKDVESQLQMHLDLKNVGTVKADDRTNQIIVQTLPDRMTNIEQLIKSLDKKSKAVLIDTKIIKIVLSDQRDTGVQWEGLFQVAAKFGMAYIGSYPFSVINTASTANFMTRNKYFNSPIADGGVNRDIGSYPFSGNTASTSGGQKITPGQMHVGIVDQKHDYDVLIKYLQTLGTSKVIASPSLAVVNNQEAKIHIGERRAYVTTTTTTGTTTSTVSEAVTYVDVGVRLAVIPTINDDGYVTMKLKPEISSIIGNVRSSSNNVIPIIDTNTAETTVIAKDGATVIIGGLGREEKIESSEQVPFFGNIPFIGALFRNRTTKTEHVELVIMLTPIIFEGDRLINLKDAEKMPVKPAKNFDVFRPELPMTPSEVFIPINEDFMPKNFKNYEGGTLYRSRGPEEISFPGDEPPQFASKDIKPYSNKEETNFPVSQAVVAPSSFAKDEAGPKGFRQYN